MLTKDGVDRDDPLELIRPLDVLAGTLMMYDPGLKQQAQDIKKRIRPSYRRISTLKYFAHKVNTRGTDSQTDKLRAFMKKETGFIVPSRKDIKALADFRLPELYFDGACPINETHRVLKPLKPGQKRKKSDSKPREALKTGPGVFVRSYRDALVKSVE